MSAPWTFDEARDKCREASLAQQHAERAYVEAARDYALAEERYRKALGERIVEVSAEGKMAAQLVGDRSRGDVAAIRRERDIAEGVREAMQQAVWRRVADRKDAQRLAEWSMRRELAEGGQPTEQPAVATFGGRRAA